MGAIYLLLILAGWCAWVRFAWRLPWGATLRPRHYRREQRRLMAAWAREAGWCTRHHAYAGGCPDTALVRDPMTGREIPMRWVEVRLSPMSTHGYSGRWETFDGAYWQPVQRGGVPFIEPPAPLR